MNDDSTAGKLVDLRKNKPILFYALVGALVLILILAGIAVFSMFGSPQQSVDRIDVTTQQMGGATMYNYLPVLNEKIDWNKLKDDEREKIARYAVNAAIEKATADGARDYNIMGMSYDWNTVFLYSLTTEQITLYVEDGYVSIPLEP